jgi:hypothetical protein
MPSRKIIGLPSYLLVTVFFVSIYQKNKVLHYSRLQALYARADTLLAVLWIPIHRIRIRIQQNIWIRIQPVVESASDPEPD